MTDIGQRDTMAWLPWIVLRRLRRPADENAEPDTDNTPGLSVVMAAHNEEDVIVGCIDSVRALADEVIVLDAESTDATARLAAENGALVQPTLNHSMLEVNKNIALDAASRDWVLVLDPDERVSPLLARQIRAVVNAGPSPTHGYWMPRRNYILGQWFRTMGMYPGAQLRLVRRGRGRFSEEEHHLAMQVPGPVECLTGDLLHFSDPTVREIVRKRTAYAEFAASQLYERGVAFRGRDLAWVPIRSFSMQYFLLGGWLEGARGLIYAGLSAYGALLRHARLWELRRTGRTPS